MDLTYTEYRAYIKEILRQMLVDDSDTTTTRDALTIL